MAEQREEIEQGIAEGSTFGRKKIFVIHDGIEETELDKMCTEKNGRHYFEAIEDTRHSPLSATMQRSCFKNGYLFAITAEKEIMKQWVQFKPTITTIVMGQQDLMKLESFRDADVFTQWAIAGIEELVETGRRYAEDKTEYDHRMKWGHWFLLATPKYLTENMRQRQPGEYNRIRTAVEEAMIEKRKEFHEKNVIVFKAGRNIVEHIREAVSKLVCHRCRSNYNRYGVRVGWFEFGGCDDSIGEEWICGILEEGAE